MRQLLLILSLICALPAFAVEPDEILSDPALETRARELSKGLRCLVCKNESIDESNAPLARDLRILLRERLVAEDSDEEAITFIVKRYGEFVLLRPSVTGSNWLLWAAGPLMLLLAGGIGFFYLRGRSNLSEQTLDELSEDEERRLAEVLKTDR
jgi:cytochrome c-type biogenesis protein CcmH